MQPKSARLVAEIGTLLRQAPSQEQLISLDKLRFDLANEVTDAMQLLYEKRKQMLWPKDAEKGLTELDRSTRLNGDVAILERDYQFLLRLETLVADRLKLGLDLLKN